jgi:hypothetical protein
MQDEYFTCEIQRLEINGRKGTEVITGETAKGWSYISKNPVRYNRVIKWDDMRESLSDNDCYWRCEDTSQFPGIQNWECFLRPDSPFNHLI